MTRFFHIKFVVYFFLFVLPSLHIHSQNLKSKVDTIYVDSIPKKILYDNKIYKLNANFASIGAGRFLSNNINSFMNGVSLNLNFHTFRECFVQVGLSRLRQNVQFEYPQKKDVTVSYFNFHLSPFVIKTENIRFAFVFTPVGITYGGGYKDETFHYKGIITQDSMVTIQNNYFGLNYYSSVQCIYKFKYDLGIGADVYAEYHQDNFMIIGLKICFYFSSAFRGNQTKPAWYYKKNPDKL